MAITKIATVEVGAGGAASIDFTGIPGTMTDLMVMMSARSNFAEHRSVPLVQYNGSTTGYTYRRLYGIPTIATGSDTASFQLFDYITGASATASTFGNGCLYIPNYAGSSYKSSSSDGVAEMNFAYGGLSLVANLWSNTAAITSIKIYSADWSFVQYSTATLYGITKGSSGGVSVS